MSMETRGFQPRLIPQPEMPQTGTHRELRWVLSQQLPQDTEEFGDLPAQAGALFPPAPSSSPLQGPWIHWNGFNTMNWAQKKQSQRNGHEQERVGSVQSLEKSKAQEILGKGNEKEFQVEGTSNNHQIQLLAGMGLPGAGSSWELPHTRKSHPSQQHPWAPSLPSLLRWHRGHREASALQGQENGIRVRKMGSGSGKQDWGQEDPTFTAWELDLSV